MKALDYIILVVICSLLYAAVRRIRKGKGACSGNCAACSKKCR